MHAFVTIAEQGSLTAAADALGRSQPTLVRTLAALERHLGVLLLRRTTRRMSLTPEGRDYLERCRRILADVEEAERAAGQRLGEPRGTIRMTAPVEFGRQYLVPLITAFLRRYDKVRVDLQLVDRNVDLVEEEIDLAIRIGELADSSMIAIRVGQVRRVTVASSALLARTAVPKHPRDLRGLPCIRQQNIPRMESTWRYQESGRAFDVAVDGAFGVNQIAAAIAACREGAGFARFLSYQVRAPINAGELQLVLEDYEPAPLPVHLVFPEARSVTARQNALVDWLKEAFINQALP